MIGIVTGMEAYSRKWNTERAAAEAVWRGVRKMMADCGMTSMPRFVARIEPAWNQDAIIARISVDSSAWTGR